ncbi:MAG: sce7726 family protein [Patescibacteria group bacterium]|nr:sce7726 family protein [Patescibacteria group bacterium]
MSYQITPTNDSMIRVVLRKKLEKKHAKDKHVRIIDELGLHHGDARVDIAVVNGVMHGYEIKSDQDTLFRLPEQIQVYNSVFDKMTLVVGKSHLYEAIKIVPDWWGVIVAKTDTNGNVIFNTIRKEETNKAQNQLSVAKLLWREEALRILEDIDEAKGLRSKPRDLIYTKLSTVLDQKTLNKKVRETIFFRTDWRSESPLLSYGG